jgi:hypothetical protein
MASKTALFEHVRLQDVRENRQDTSNCTGTSSRSSIATSTEWRITNDGRNRRAVEYAKPSSPSLYLCFLPRATCLARPSLCTSRPGASTSSRRFWRSGTLFLVHFVVIRVFTLVEGHLVRPLSQAGRGNGRGWEGLWGLRVGFLRRGAFRAGSSCKRMIGEELQSCSTVTSKRISPLISRRNQYLLGHQGYSSRGGGWLGLSTTGRRDEGGCRRDRVGRG